MTCFGRRFKRIMKRVFIVFLALLLLSAVFIRWLNKKLDVIVSDIVSEQLIATITELINESVHESMSQGNYNGIMSLSYSSDGKVRSLSIDSVKVNLLRSDVSKRIYEKLEELAEYDVYVSISNIFDDVIIFGRSNYLFRADIFPVGGIETDVKSEFISAGINQTNYKMNMTVDVGITAVMLISTVTIDVSTSVSVAEMLIVGDVPTVYWE